MVISAGARKPASDGIRIFSLLGGRANPSNRRRDSSCRDVPTDGG